MQGLTFFLPLMLLLCAAPACGGEQVVMVTIDEFAQAGRERAVNEARFAALTGTMELYAAVGPDEVGYPPRLTAKGRENLMRDKVIRKMGIVPRPFFPFGQCIPMPAKEAYVQAYSEASEAYFRNKLGADFREQIEREVQRQLRFAKKGQVAPAK